jgi:hypothetical protein
MSQSRSQRKREREREKRMSAPKPEHVQRYQNGKKKQDHLRQCVKDCKFGQTACTMNVSYSAGDQFLESHWFPTNWSDEIVPDN